MRVIERQVETVLPPETKCLTGTLLTHKRLPNRVYPTVTPIYIQANSYYSYFLKKLVCDPKNGFGSNEWFGPD
jgi:hypothetical protein